MRSEDLSARPLADYHLHTTASDGRKSPAQMVAQALDTGLCQMAVTDHDTVAGVLPAVRAAAGRIPVIPGIEFTCREQALAPGQAAVSLHLLGYGIDVADPALNAALDARAAAVRAAYDALLQKLAAAGCPLRYEAIPARCGPNHLELADIDAAVQAARPGDPALPALRAMVAEHAAVMDRQNIPLPQAVALIHGAGGLAVWAHPLNVYRRFHKTGLTLPQVEQALQHTLLPLGLDGLEAGYRAFAAPDQAQLAALAAAHGLFCTVGSDCHGCPPRDTLGQPCPPDWLLAARCRAL